VERKEMGIRRGRAEKEEYVVYTPSGEPSRVIQREEAKNLKPDEWLQGVTCFIINPKGEVLLEKREKSQEDPGMLDLCSGHVNNGEMTIHAIVRELDEELGIPFEIACNVKKIVDLQAETKGGQHFFVTVYALFLGDYTVEYQKEEIEEIFYQSRKKVYALLRENALRIQYNESWEEAFEKIEARCQEKGVSHA